MKNMTFVMLFLSMALTGCALGSSRNHSRQVDCGRFEICHANHIHRNSRHHTDVHHHQHDAKQISD